MSFANREVSHNGRAGLIAADRRRFPMCAVALAPPRLSQTTRPERSERAAARALEQALLVRYHRAGDLAAREELVERFLPFARDLARRYSYTDESFDDLVQVASVGLIKAIDRFDPDRGAKFTSFAAPTILGELKRHFRDKGWALHVPRDLQERTLAVTRETEALSKSLGRSPKVREVANSLGCSVEAVLEAQEASASYEAASLDAPTSREDDEAARSDRHARRRRLGLRARREPRRDRQHLESPAGRRAQGARAALHARPHTARNRRPDRLLANARLTPATTRAQPSRYSRHSSVTRGVRARAALLRLFERFIIHVDRDTRQGRIETVVRPEAIQTVEGEEMRPVLHPTPLKIQSVGDATR